MKVLMTGNEAIARGAYEHGVVVAAAYPGTPSTEILENIAQYREIKGQWSPNEKVAMEVGVGAAIAGARSLVAMKHVGVNVAADPLFTVSYTGINGGLVLISADDPGMHSSQNEQDNRIYARFSKIALLEPSDSQECKDFLGLALEISEKFDTPVMIRTTTRISHSKSLVELGEPMERQSKPYEKNAKKFVAVPANARLRHIEVEKRLAALAEYSETCPANRIEWGSRRIGVITSGICYQYVREALPDASVLKLGMTNPLPMNLITRFAAEVDELWVIEELEPLMEEQINAAGIPCMGSQGCIPFYGKDLLPRIGELSPSILREQILGEVPVAPLQPAEVPMRPPVLCPGCPHRGVFYTLKQLKLTVTGDIGCYTLGAMAPLDSIDTTICMGASVPMALGFEKAHPELAGKTVAVIGDSTFLHSGVTGLMDIVYNGGTGTVMILDNSITAMTGHQDNPATGRNLHREETNQVDLVALCRAVGVKRVREVDAYDLAGLKQAVSEEVAVREPSVIIVRRACALIVKQDGSYVQVDHDKCTGCRACMRIGCPAISHKDRKSSINPTLCVGCAVCVQVCRFNAMVKEGGNNA